ncbi:hypothetical protein PUN28_008511 [Cardiocondyla obscurior]|uniref:Uncharacterized protein n=1 Tax=Cardiocondyla obscurior TaxID=286306 RepID=A0AAW2G162_9HYME
MRKTGEREKKKKKSLLLGESFRRSSLYSGAAWSVRRRDCNLTVAGGQSVQSGCGRHHGFVQRRRLLRSLPVMFFRRLRTQCPIARISRVRGRSSTTSIMHLIMRLSLESRHFKRRYLFSVIHMAVLFVVERLNPLTVIVEIIEKVNNMYHVEKVESYVPCSDSYARCVGGCAVGAMSLKAAAERLEQPVQPAPLALVPLGQPEAVAEAASRSEVVGSPSYCSEDAAKRQGSVLIPMPGWGSWELIKGQVNAHSTTSDAALITM